MSDPDMFELDITLDCCRLSCILLTANSRDISSAHFFSVSIFLPLSYLLVYGVM